MSAIRRSARNLFRARWISRFLLMMASSAEPGFRGIQLIGGNADDVEPERNALSGCRRADRACVHRMRSGEPRISAGTAAAARSRCQRKARSYRRPPRPLSRAGGERADGSEGKLAVARYLTRTRQGDG